MYHTNMTFLSFLILGFLGNALEKCVTKGLGKCTQYKVCTEDVSHHIYPGRIKTLVQDLYIPRGVTQKAFISLTTTTDKSVILSDAYLAFQDATLTMANRTYTPEIPTTPGQGVLVSTGAKYHFGDMDCKGLPLDISTSESTVSPIDVSTTESTVSPLEAFTTESTTSSIVEDSCYYCLVQLAVEYLMADITGVPDNSTRTVTATLVSVNETIEVATTLVLRPLHNPSGKSNFSTDIPDVVDFPLGSVKAFQLQTMFPNSLSTYKLEIKSPNIHLRIATVLIRSAGDHYKGIIATANEPHPDDASFCSEVPDTRVIDFGYLPNKGASEGTTADTINLEVILFMTNQAIPGKTYPLDILLEEDDVLTKNATIDFHSNNNVTQIEKLDVTDTQINPFLPKSGTGSASLTFDLPPYSSGKYEVKTSTKRITGPGGEGLNVAAILLTGVGSNVPCIKPFFKKSTTSGSINVTNIPYTLGSFKGTNNTFGFKISIIALPDLVEAYSTHELTVDLLYQGDGSPQTFKFYFNITNQEVFTTPDIHGNIPMEIRLSEKCRSMTLSNEVVLTLRTQLSQPYGRLFVELPIPIGSVGQSFTMCDFRKKIGWNVVGRFFPNITKINAKMIERVFLDISPLTNIHFPEYDQLKYNELTMNMVVTFKDTDIYVNNLPMSFKARIISNNIPIWSEELPIAKPEIEYYPDFIVMTGIERIADVNSQNIWYHYSRNGSYFHREALVFKDDSNECVFEFPMVIAYFHISADPCVVICNVTKLWLPLKEYVTIVNDEDNAILRMVPYALDQDLDTCFDLPIPGDSPSMLWLRITKLSLFNVTSKRFVVHITGEGIECARVGQTNLQVGTSGPTYNDQCSIDSEIAFCKLMPENTNSTLVNKTQCDIECECKEMLQCSNVHIVMQSTNKDVWRLCELTMEDVLG